MNKITMIFVAAVFGTLFLYATPVHAEDCWGPLNGSSIWGNSCDDGIDDNDNDDDDNDNDNDSDDLQVVTNSATNVDDDSATLRGEITDLDESEDYDRWFEWGTDNDDLDHTATISGTTDDEGDFSKTISGLSDDRTYYFRACAESDDSNDEDCGSVRSFRTDDEDSNDDDNDNDDDSNSDGGVVTTDATGITVSSAILNGVVVNDGGSQRVWFAWGTTTYLGNTTSSRNVSGDQNLVSIELGGLAANQSYFFRLMSDTGEMGDMKAFMTKPSVNTGSTGGTTPTPTTKPPVTVVTSAQYLNVDLVANLKEVKRGDTVLYAVVYENLSNTALKNLTISVDFPEGVTVVNGGEGIVSGQKVSIFLPAFGAKAKGDFTVETKVSESGRNEKFLVSVIEGSYEHPSDENTMISTLDYSMLKFLRGGGNDQAANALNAFGFFPGSFLGWLIIIGIAVIIILLARIASKKKDDKHDADKPMKKDDSFELKIAK